MRGSACTDFYILLYYALSNPDRALPDVRRNCTTVDGVDTAVNPISWKEIRTRRCNPCPVTASSVQSPSRHSVSTAGALRVLTFLIGNL
ncbi:hypothetical protein PUN28_004776 [Cardiocondyla obscurior]|uniref:Uncharacterized protein n=1 Tax=Cardiocondyla obscurior TaxID=286306 RepID=A0AAW2GIJ9_9HYME